MWIRNAGRRLSCVVVVTAIACTAENRSAESAAGDSTSAADASRASRDSAPVFGANPAGSPSAGSPPAPAKPPIIDSHASVPPCPKPVSVTYYARGGIPDEFIVTFGGLNGVQADTLIDRLAARHGFTATHRYQGAFSGFSARLSPPVLAAMRCEPSVTRISQVVVGGISAPPPL